MERITEQHRQWGIMPQVEAAEAFIDPILRKVEVKHEQDRQADALRVLGTESPVPDGEYLGTYDWNLKTDEVKPYEGSWMPKPDGPEEVIRKCVRDLLKVPETAHRLTQISLICGRHNSYVEFCNECRTREVRFHEIMWEAYQRFGDPTKPKTPKIIVG